MADRPLLWLFPWYAAGIALGWQLGGGGAGGPLALAAGLAVPVFLFHSNFRQSLKKYLGLILVPAVFCLGWGLAGLSLTRPGQPHHLLQVMAGRPAGEPVIVGGVVREGSGGRPGENYRLILDAREILIPGDEGPSAVTPVTGRARISVGGRLTVEVGDYVRLPVVLRPLAGFKNPGGLDFEKYWGSQGLWVGGWVKSPRLVTSWPRAFGAGPWSRWRSRAVEFVESRTAGSPASGPLSAMLTGRRGAVDEAGEELFRTLGLSHLLSVSGLHLGLWYGVCFWVFRRVLRRVPRVGRRIRIDVAAAALAVPPALFYAGLVGPASPVLRSAAMIAAVAGAFLALRKADPWNILAAAAWALLLVEPGRLFTVSFQLSFAATAAMLAVFVPRPGARPKALHQGFPARVGTFFKNSALAALAGTLGTAPLVVWHFGRAPLIGLAANLVFTPFISFAVLVPGLIALALSPLSPGLAAWILAWSEGALTWIWPFMERLAQAAGPGLWLPAPGAWFLAAWFLAGWVWLRSPRPWRVRLGLAAAILAAGALPGLIRGPGTVGELRVTVLDVGQGSSIHVNLPDGRQMLVDGGGGYDFDPGESVITPYLQRQGLSRLDLAVLTHPDQDHLKGLITVAANFKPREVWTAPWPDDISPLYQRFRQIIPSKTLADLGPLYAGRRFGPAEARLFWPPQDMSWLQGPVSGARVNDHGLVLRLSWGGAAFLVTGDIGPRTERALAARYGPALRSTVLIAPHHGGRTSLTPEFMAAVRPDWVVFSVGRHNSYNFPHPEAVARALRSGARIWRTDISGAAVFTVREDNQVMVSRSAR